MKKLNELQTVELNMLAEFSRVAEREKLDWFVMFGTLLGAVREKGFIPWDDDIDIALPRVDYDRLRTSNGWFNEPYFLQTPHNDPAAAPHFIRLRRSDTAVLINYPNNLTKGGNMGAYIDILPLDDVPNGFRARAMHETSCQMQRQMLVTAALDECGVNHMPEGKLDFCYSNGGIAGYYKFFADRYEAYCSQYSNAQYYAMPVLLSERGRRVFEKEWFDDRVKMDFEGLTVPAPIGWKETLIASYPEGLCEPEERRRKAKHTENCIVDMHRSYKEYTRRYTDMLCDIGDKEVFIFGAGDSLRIWLERYGKGLSIAGAFDNGKSKWGKTAYGVPVYPPSEITERLGQNPRIIIASIYHDEISVQLEKMGIIDYYIFIDGLGYKREETVC